MFKYNILMLIHQSRSIVMSILEKYIFNGRWILEIIIPKEKSKVEERRIQKNKKTKQKLVWEKEKKKTVTFLSI